MLIPRFSTLLIVGLTLGLAGLLAQPGATPSLAMVPEHQTLTLEVNQTAPGYLIDLGRRRPGSGHRPRLD
jgi:hypothetical protein